jgi:hypothetical protein
MSDRKAKNKDAWKFLHRYGLVPADGEASVRVQTLANIIQDSMFKASRDALEDAAQYIETHAVCQNHGVIEITFLDDGRKMLANGIRQLKANPPGKE